MKYRWKKMNTSSIGITDISAPDAGAVRSVARWPWRKRRAIGSV